MSNETTKTPIDIMSEIWGIIFSSMSLLSLIALVSHLINPLDNVLGPYMGKALAAGLIVLFGALPAFAFPFLLGLVGYYRIRCKAINARLLVFVAICTFEICILLGISSQPIQSFAPNLAGTVVAYFMQQIFGLHVFGPYFITSLSLAITLLLAFRIHASTVAKALLGYVKPLLAWFASVMRGAPKSEDAIDEQPVPRNAISQDVSVGQIITPKRKRAQKDTPEEAEGVPIAPGEDASDDAKQLFQNQLAEFRAKKNVPITITTGEPEVAALDYEETGESDSEAESAFLARVQNEDEVSDPSDLSDVLRENVSDDTALAGGVAAEEILNGDPSAGCPDSDSVNGVVAAPTDVPPDYFKVPQAEVEAKRKKYAPYVIPSSTIIASFNEGRGEQTLLVDKDEIEKYSATLEKTLLSFGLEGKVVNVCPGPVVTRYEIELAPGIKVSRVVSLQDDISMAVGGQKIRIQAPIPGKAAIGIELPNKNRQMVYFYDIVNSDSFNRGKGRLPIVIGRTISGSTYVSDIAKMPHLLIAGQTGAGKSVCINSFICSMLLTKTPEELRLIMIDPKKVELSYYQGIPHLLAPVVTESKEAVKALRWGMIEMDRRYRLLAKAGARNIESFNEKVVAGKLSNTQIPDEDNKSLPFIVIIVDELADLMMTASKDVESSIQRIAQLARAVGIHLIVATQRPSVDIITGPIKANLTSRIAFRTIQSTDSRTILGHVGSEKLLGQGDMLFLRSGAPDIERYHAAFISEEEVEKIVEAVRQDVDIEKMESFDTGDDDDDDMGSSVDDSDRDTLFEEAARMIVSIGQGSTSLLQRRMKIGYARAGRLMDELERAGFVGPAEGSKVREVLVKPMELEEWFSRR